MHPAFVARGAAPAVPITFVTAANWPQHRSQLDAAARAFAEAAGFEPKAGRHLLLPAPDGSLAGVLFALEAEDDPLKDTFRPGAPGDAAARRQLPLRQCAARRASGRAGDRARRLSLQPLPQSRGQGRQARAARRCRRRRREPHRRGRLAGARPDQHAGERHGTAGTRIRGARARDRARRERERDRGRGSSARRTSR